MDIQTYADTLFLKCEEFALAQDSKKISVPQIDALVETLPNIGSFEIDEAVGAVERCLVQCDLADWADQGSPVDLADLD